jgi:hypothetical protein
MIEHFGASSATVGALKSLSAGGDPKGYFRRQAGRSDSMPGLGHVRFVANFPG